MRSLILILTCLLVQYAYSQTGQLKGSIVDNEGDTLSFASIMLLRGDTMINGTQADVHGNYVLTKIKPGTYDVKFSSVGLESQTAKGVVIEKSKVTYLNSILNGPVELKEIII